MIYLLIYGLILIPLTISCFFLLFNNLNEKVLSRISILASLVYSAFVVYTFALWLLRGQQNLVLRAHVRFADHNFSFAFLYDYLSAVFLMLTAICSFSVIYFSRVYLHREQGFARFFAMIYLLVSAMSMMSLADQFESFFIGWELVGFSSFFLISFYFHQQRTVINALKVFALYRLGDLGLLLAIAVSHRFAGGAEVYFSDLWQLVADPGHYSLDILVIGLAILLAASVKSAQIPFSFWLPRAMEGPTPSSAIFYGGLTIHLGLLLLLRTVDLWGQNFIIRAFMLCSGLLTALFANSCARSQSSIKGQLAYASVAQVGLMYIELALGWHILMVWHLIVHTLVRSLQLLLSPSILTEAMQNSSSSINTIKKLNSQNLFLKRLWATYYVIMLHEGYFERVFRIITRWIQIYTQSTYFWPCLMGFFVTSALFGLSQIGGSYFLIILSLLASFLALYLAFSIHRFLTTLLGILITQSIVLLCFYLANGSWHDGMEVFVFASLLSSFILFVMYNHLSSRIALHPRMFSNAISTQPRTIAWMFVFAGVLIAAPPSPGFFIEDQMMHVVFEKSMLSALLMGFTFACNGFAMIRAVALLGMGGGKVV